VDGVLVGLGPVDNPDRVSGLSIFGVGGKDLKLPVPGWAKLLEVVIEGGNLLEAGDVVRMMAIWAVFSFSGVSRPGTTCCA
jgi:hypothetical protein